MHPRFTPLVWSGLLHAGDDWNTPNLPSCEIIDDDSLSFYLAQLVISLGTEARELSSDFHPVEPC